MFVLCLCIIEGNFFLKMSDSSDYEDYENESDAEVSFLRVLRNFCVYLDLM